MNGGSEPTIEQLMKASVALAIMALAALIVASIAIVVATEARTVSNPMPTRCVIEIRQGEITHEYVGAASRDSRGTLVCRRTSAT